MIEFMHKPVCDLKQNERDTRMHSKKQTSQIAGSIKAFGFVNPIIVDENNVLTASTAPR